MRPVYGNHFPLNDAMQLTIVSIVSEHFNESDYETAVDMSHWSQSSVSYNLLSPAGVRLALTREETHKSYSYLEPDFDLMAKTGECVYEHHASDERGSYEVSLSAQVDLPSRLFLLTEQDFRNRNLWQFGEIETLGRLTSDEQERLHADSYSEPDFLFLSCDAILFERLASYQKGQQIDAGLVLPELFETLQENERIARQILNENASTRIQNMATEAIFDLSCWRQMRISTFEHELTEALASFRP